jgi:hypothetical protein
MSVLGWFEADVFETAGGSRLERSEFSNGKRAVRVSDLRGCRWSRRA